MAKRTQPLRVFEELILRETDDHIFWPLKTNFGGYVVLTVDGKRIYGHRFVLERRTGPAPQGMFACHTPGIGCARHCINYRHLRWDNVTGNNADMAIDGTRPQGETHHHHILTVAQVREMRELYRTGTRVTDLAKMFGVHIVTTSKVVHRQTWNWLD